MCTRERSKLAEETTAAQAFSWMKAPSSSLRLLLEAAMMGSGSNSPVNAP